MFPALHELFIDDFAGIVLAGLDMNRLLHDCIRAATKGTSGAVLELSKPERENRDQRHRIRNARVRDLLVWRAILQTHLAGNRCRLLRHGRRDVRLFVLEVGDVKKR